MIVEFKNFIASIVSKKQRVLDNPISSRTELMDRLTELGDSKRELARIWVELNDKLAEIYNPYMRTGEEIKARISALETIIAEYAELNRDTLLEGCDGKTVDLGIAKIMFYKPAKRLVPVPDAFAALEELRELGLETYIRVTEELEKQAIKDDWDDNLENKLVHIRISDAKEKVMITIVGTEM